MLKSIAAGIAAGALMFGAAAASPVKGLSVSQSGQASTADRAGGVLDFVAEQFRISISAALAMRSSTPPQGEPDEHPYPSSDHECEGADHSGKPDSEPKEGKEKAPQGPEPIYFGF